MKRKKNAAALCSYRAPPIRPATETHAPHLSAQNPWGRGVRPTSASALSTNRNTTDPAHGDGSLIWGSKGGQARMPDISITQPLSGQGQLVLLENHLDTLFVSCPQV